MDSEVDGARVKPRVAAANHCTFKDQNLQLNGVRLTSVGHVRDRDDSGRRATGAGTGPQHPNRYTDAASRREAA